MIFVFAAGFERLVLGLHPILRQHLGLGVLALCYLIEIRFLRTTIALGAPGSRNAL